MKKFVTFTNFMVLLGIMTILFYLIPAINITADSSTSTQINLFTATFGGAFMMSNQSQPLVACGGLVTAFCLGVVAIICTLLKSKNKLMTLLAFPLYTTSGVLVCCAATMVHNVNANHPTPAYFSYSLAGGAITVAVFFFILAFFALVDFIATIAKPKQPQNPAY